jgi:hypothetical protein
MDEEESLADRGRSEIGERAEEHADDQNPGAPPENGEW